VSHGLLLTVVVAAPLFLGDGGEALTEAVAELLSPVGLLLLPVFGRFPDAVHRVGGSPVSVAFMLLLILALLYYHSSLCPPPRAARTEHGGAYGAWIHGREGAKTWIPLCVDMRYAATPLPPVSLSSFTHLTVLPSLFPDPVKEPPRDRFEKVD